MTTCRAYKLPVQMLYNLITEAGVAVESVYDGQDVVPIGNLIEFKDTALSVDDCVVRVSYNGEYGTFYLVFWGAAPGEIISDYSAPEDSPLMNKMEEIFDKFVDLFDH